MEIDFFLHFQWMYVFASKREKYPTTQYSVVTLQSFFLYFPFCQDPRCTHTWHVFQVAGPGIRIAVPKEHELFLYIGFNHRAMGQAPEIYFLQVT